MDISILGLPAIFKSRVSHLFSGAEPVCLHCCCIPKALNFIILTPRLKEKGKAQMNTLTSQVIVAHYSKSIGVSISQNRIYWTAEIKHLNLIIKPDFAYRIIPLKS